MSLEERVVKALRERGWRVATAESCTGGLVAERITRIPGAGDVFEGGVIAYSDRAKASHLGVARSILDVQGGVSREAALAMAQGARERFVTDLAVSTTGFAGPGAPQGGEVGLVFLALAGEGHTEVHEMRYAGTRAQIKDAAAQDALRLILEKASGKT